MMVAQRKKNTEKNEGVLEFKHELLCRSVAEWFCQGSKSDKSELKLCKEFTSEMDVQVSLEQATAVKVMPEDYEGMWSPKHVESLIIIEVIYFHAWPKGDKIRCRWSTSASSWHRNLSETVMREALQHQQKYITASRVCHNYNSLCAVSESINRKLWD